MPLATIIVRISRPSTTSPSSIEIVVATDKISTIGLRNCRANIGHHLGQCTL